MCGWARVVFEVTRAFAVRPKTAKTWRKEVWTTDWPTDRQSGVYSGVSNPEKDYWQRKTSAVRWHIKMTHKEKQVLCDDIMTHNYSLCLTCVNQTNTPGCTDGRGGIRIMALLDWINMANGQRHLAWYVKSYTTSNFWKESSHEIPALCQIMWLVPSTRPFQLRGIWSNDLTAVARVWPSLTDWPSPV